MANMTAEDYAIMQRVTLRLALPGDAYLMPLRKPATMPDTEWVREDVPAAPELETEPA